MLSKDEAREKVQQLLNTYRSPGPDDSLVIVEESTIQRPFVWVFFYTSKKYLETREFRYAIAGNGPVIVNKRTGEVFQCGSAPPIEKWIEDYERTLG